MADHDKIPFQLRYFCCTLVARGALQRTRIPLDGSRPNELLDWDEHGKVGMREMTG